MGGAAGTTTEKKVRRDAPARGGGPGHFKDPQTLSDGGPGPSLSPAARHSSRSATTTGLRKAPPQTVPNKERLIKRFNPAVDIEVWLEILPDGTDSSVHGAVTHFEMGGVSWLTPGYNWRPRGGRKIVTAINGRFEMKGVITIQTLYGLSSSPTDLSLYGRGTTPRDKAAGNVTLGFHEHCHRVDFRRYLKKNPLPRFRARTGMTEEAFLRAGNQLDRAMRAYSRKMKEASDRRTDEVGYTRAQCRRDGKC